MSTRWDTYRSDPRVIQAEQLLADAWAEHGGRLGAVHPADDELTASYDELLATAKRVRGAPLWYPYVGSGLGHGPWVELADGSVKCDMIGGIGVLGVGHGHPKVREAVLHGALEDLVMAGNLQQNAVAFQVQERLLRLAEGSKLSHCFLTSSGAMANENALKVAFQARHPASRLLAFDHAFAGRTLALAQITDKAAYRDGLPTTLAVDRLPFFDADDPAGSTARCMEAFKEHLIRFPGQHAACVIECIQGEGGYYAADAEFLQSLCQACHAHNILVIIDEVQTFARTDQAFAFQHFGLQELVDIVTVGKWTQCCATLWRHELQPRPGLISQTFTASSTALHAARAMLDLLLEPDVLGAGGILERGADMLRAGIWQLAKDYPDIIYGPFGHGGMLAFTWRDGDREGTLAVARRLFDRGLILFVAGSEPMRLRMLPPLLTMTEVDIDAVLTILRAECEQGTGRWHQ